MARASKKLVTNNQKAVRKQLEFYFSDSNLSRDGFFRAELQRSSDASLSIELLLNCNQLKCLGATEDVIVAAARQSKQLEIVREDIESTDNGKISTINWLIDRLKKFGGVNFVKVPRFRTSGFVRGFAFVEFEDSEAAERALAALAPTENDLFEPPPSLPNVSTRSADSAWMPREAVHARMSTSDRLARQYVWRCCSRRSKQSIASCRRLYAAGYRLPNPLEAEYRLITEGQNSTLSKVHENHFQSVTLIEAPLGQEGKANNNDEHLGRNLRLVPYCEWLKWRPLFYAWLKAWTLRIDKKTKQLVAQEERRQRPTNTDTLPTLDTSCVDVLPMKTALPSATLPDNFCTGTVVELYWPLEVPPTIDDENLPIPRYQIEPRLQMRRVRASIERTLLAPNNLLRHVLHFDSNPYDCAGLLTLARPSASHTRCFLRFCGPESASEFVASSQLVVGEDVSAAILEGEREKIYCANIMVAKAGMRERRRRQQASKRQRQAKQENMEETASVAKTKMPTPKRILFDG